MNDPASNFMSALADDIKLTLKREAANHAEWVEIKLALCSHFVDGKSRFRDTDLTGFGEWLESEGINVSHQDRAAYIAMGATPEYTRTVLEATERKSIRYIHEFEYNPPFTHVGKSPKKKAKPLSKKKVKTYATIQAAAEHGATVDELAKRHNVSTDHVKEVLSTPLPPSESEVRSLPISATAQQRLDAHRRKLDKEFEESVRVEAIKLHDQWREDNLKSYTDRLTKLERQLVHRQGVMKASEYKTLMMVCHPDTGPNASEDRRNEAVRILTHYKINLLDEKQDQFKHGLPRTREEMEKARAEVRARNSERAKAAARKRKEKAESG